MPASQDCIFCQIVAGAAPSTVVHEDDRTLAFMNIAPATPGHLLVIPKAHATDLLDVPPDDLAASARTAQRIARRVTDVLGADGVNLVHATRPVAGQTVFHVHLHVLPRYVDDGVQGMWTPTPGDPEAIRSLGERLRGAGT
ncbi:HIT family protein [Promicromonospora citrea]|uniref:HIT family protein n=1 Tax=Promicromonospora citrea TaxID=43677 RepID=UPI001E3004A4|nr:HIT family protein [Promicromonospora citrea]